MAFRAANWACLVAATVSSLSVPVPKSAFSPSFSPPSLSALAAAATSNETTPTSDATNQSTVERDEKEQRRTRDKDLLPSGGNVESWVQSFRNACECPRPVRIADVAIPTDFPIGTYYRNGAGLYVAEDGTKVLHQFDGDGLVNAITVHEDGTATFRNRFVRTDGYKSDRIKGGFTGRGIFGTPKSGGVFRNMFDMSPKNVANTNVLYFKESDTLLALWEGGHPYVLDADTLCTIGKREDLRPFSAHPRYDPKKNTWVNHGVENPDPVTGASRIALYELDADTGCVVSGPVSLSVTGAALMHDSAITDKYVILGLNDCGLDAKGGLKALLGMGSFAGALRLEEGGAHTILCVPRSLLESGSDGDVIDALEDDRVRKIKTPFSFSFHFGNAYDDADGNVVFDRVDTDDESFDFGIGIMEKAGRDTPLWEAVPWEDVRMNSFVRYKIDPVREVLLEATTLANTGAVEFPTVSKSMSTRSHRFVYAVATHDPTSECFGIHGTLCKYDATNGSILASYSLCPDDTMGEPCVVPKVGGVYEDDVYVMTITVNGLTKTSDLVILDGKSMEEVCRATLPAFVPNGGLHGRFEVGVVHELDVVDDDDDDDAISRRVVSPPPR